MIDHGDQLVVRPAFEIAVALAQVDVEMHFLLYWGHVGSMCQAMSNGDTEVEHRNDEVYLSRREGKGNDVSHRCPGAVSSAERGSSTPDKEHAEMFPVLSAV